MKNQHNVSVAKVIALTIFLILGANIFQFFPFLKIMREVWYVFSFLYCVLFAFIVQLIGQKYRVSGFEIYLFSIIMVMPFVSAFRALEVFGQPLIPGLLTHRVMASFGAGIALLYWVKRNVVSVEDIRVSLITAGWFCFVLYLFMYLLFDPARFGSIRGFVGGGVVEPYHFILNSKYIVFLVIYYIVVGYLKKSLMAVLLTLPLLFYLIIVDGGRAQFLSLLVVLGLFFVKYLSLKRLFMIVLPFCIALAVAIVLAYSYQQDEVMRVVEKFNSAILVVVTGKETSDASANARLREIELAMPYIKAHPFFGNGQLSAQWKGGYFGNVGYFSPSDIGIWGLLFVFGIFGLAVFYTQFVLAWMANRRQKRMIKRGLAQESALRISVVYFILFTLIESLATGRVGLAGPVSFLFIAILYVFNYVKSPKKESMKKLETQDG